MTLQLRTANFQFYILHKSDQIIHRLRVLHLLLVTYIKSLPIWTLQVLWHYGRSYTHCKQDRQCTYNVTLKADSHIACRAHAVPLPCCAAKGLVCVFPIWFIQCGRVWFTLAMPHPCHAPPMPFFSRPRHSTAVLRRGLEKNGMVAAWQVWIRHGRTV